MHALLRLYNRYAALLRTPRAGGGGTQRGSKEGVGWGGWGAVLVLG
jgi:hypothetical protein